ncbi:hypothetical protein [Streptomyces sp. NPDC046939]|uniref:hypothetical protein n=1 Tax=Streptomyces sp. NPDC046939 TaxID=3155376 RepID=UPI0033C4A17E
MRARTVGAVCAAPLLALALTGCQALSGSGDDKASGKPSPSGDAAVFLATGECAVRGRTGFGEAGCGSGHAVARVVARHEGDTANGPACPARTDFVLRVSETRATPDGHAADENGDGKVTRGYACMRNLRPPHPGDPGAGGGPRTIVGDCVYATGRGQVRETACDGSGGHAPQYRVRSAVPDRIDCPASTVLYVTLSGTDQVGCAVRT